MLPILFQALPKWDGKYNSTALNISKMLSEGRDVFYVEHPFSWVDFFRGRNRDQMAKRRGKLHVQPFSDHPNFHVIHPPLTLPINSLPDGNLHYVLLNAFIRKLWSRIDKVLESFGYNEFGYVNSFDPVYFNFESKLKCKYKVYHSVDLIEGEPYIAKHGVVAERTASLTADQVITTSYPLAKRLKRFNLKTTCIPNAADFNHFVKKIEEPIEYQLINRKRIVYTGNIGLRIDYKALEEISDRFPQHELVIIGPKDDRYFKGQHLLNKENVTFLGPRNYQDLPAYLHHADVLIIPFLCNDLTHHIYPLKINEYLATGKPIVSSRFTEFNEFEEHMYIYDKHHSVTEVVEKAMLENDQMKQQKRIDLASLNTWDHRIEDWNNILAELD